LTRKLKPVEVELDGEVQHAVLSLPLTRDDGTVTTVGDLLAEAKQALALANQTIEENALVQITAAEMVRRTERRGEGRLVGRLDGTVVLRVYYGEDPYEALPVARTKLPTIEVLRAQAEDLKVDISDLGRAKLQIIERLDAVRKSNGTPSRLRDEVQEVELDGTAVSGPSQ